MSINILKHLLEIVLNILPPRLLTSGLSQNLSGKGKSKKFKFPFFFTLFPGAVSNVASSNVLGGGGAEIGMIHVSLDVCDWPEQEYSESSSKKGRERPLAEKYICFSQSVCCLTNVCKQSLNNYSATPLSTEAHCSTI